MVYAIILFILFTFVSDRLIGIRASMTRRIIASASSFIFTSAIFYTLHIQSTVMTNDFLQFDHYTFLYFITLIVVSLGFSLLLELMTKSYNEIESEFSFSPFDKIRYFASTRIRYMHLLRIISRNGLLKSPFHLNKEERNEQVAIAFKNTLEKAEGIFIKFGQFLSTRSDLFPKPFLKELSKLQEEVEAVPFSSIENIITADLGQSPDQIFQHFEKEPLAAASIAQVHSATLKSGEDVIVKVLRPHLRKQMLIDIHILMNFAELLANKTSWAKNIGIVRLTEGFIQNLQEEVDLSIELANLQQMKSLPHSPVYIPKTYEKYSTSNILVMELLEGASLNDIDEMMNDPAQKEEVLQTIFTEMLWHIFEHGIFHGDPHPGNIFILKNQQPAFIDFGSVGRLSTIQREGFKWLLVGLSRRNAEAMVHGVKKLITNEDDLNVNKLEQSLSQFITEHSFEGNLMAEMGKELFDMMSQYGLKFYPDVAGAFRSLLTLQGGLQAIDPHFNLDEVIKNFLKKSMNPKNLSSSSLEHLEDDFLNLIPKVRELPKKMDHIVDQVGSGRLTFRTSLFADEDNVNFVNSVLSIFFIGLTGFALGLLALGALFLTQAEDPNTYSFLNVFGYSGLALSVTMLIRVAIQALKRGRDE